MQRALMKSAPTHHGAPDGRFSPSDHPVSPITPGPVRVSDPLGPTPCPDTEIRPFTPDFARKRAENSPLPWVGAGWDRGLASDGPFSGSGVGGPPSRRQNRSARVADLPQYRPSEWARSRPPDAGRSTLTRTITSPDASRVTFRARPSLAAAGGEPALETRARSRRVPATRSSSAPPPAPPPP